MSNIYAEVTKMLAVGPVGLASDIDGTLSPIALKPELARITERSREALQRLHSCNSLKVIGIVTGRPALEARQMVGIDDFVYMGNHGLELLNPKSNQIIFAKEATSYASVVNTALEQLASELKALSNTNSDWVENVWVERKGITGSVHYRLSHNPDMARENILALVKNLEHVEDLRVTEGKMVVELRPAVEINKGTALVSLIESYGLSGLIYIGDDKTDAEGFLAMKRREKQTAFIGKSIGVRSVEMPDIIRETSDVLVDGVSGVEEFLIWMSYNI